MLRYNGMEFKMKDGNGKTFRVKQVTAIAARKAYDNGKTIWLHPCNMSVCSAWADPCPITNDGEKFESVVNSYKYYNCNNEVGKYPVYFIQAA